MKINLCCLFAFAGFAAAAMPIQAATVLTAAGSSLDVTSVPPPGAVGYDFFVPNGGPNVSSLPSFASVNTTGDSAYSDNSYSTLTIAGTSYHTGVVYKGGTPTGTLATITLGPGVPGNFVLGLLANSTSDGPDNNTSYTVTDNLDLASVTVNNPQPATTVNQPDFFYIDVQGATAGEVLTISGASSYQVTLGGITIDTPEPGSWVALCGLGAAGLILVVRRRRRKG
jgi:hypothetical protein